MEREVKLAVVGLGKMGLSHLAMINAHPSVRVVAMCDSSAYVLDVLEKYTGIRAYTDFSRMLETEPLDAVVIATPSHLHGKMVHQALQAGLHVFCEKPFCLDDAEGAALVELAAAKNRVNQVGYHNRFVGAFQEVHRLLSVKAIGDITHATAEAYGPVVLKPKGGGWRNQSAQGGGCLYDYAAHPLNLLTWYLGMPCGVGGTVINSIYSEQTDDEVYATLYYPGGQSAQLSVNWSDESYRKMTTSITLYGKLGKIRADRQECQVFLRQGAPLPAGYVHGWNVRYTTELTEPVWFYIRGEEYSAQLDYFVGKILQEEARENVNGFLSAWETDKVLSMLKANAAGVDASLPEGAQPARKKRFFFG